MKDIAFQITLILFLFLAPLKHDQYICSSMQKLQIRARTKSRSHQQIIIIIVPDSFDHRIPNPYVGLCENSKLVFTAVVKTVRLFICVIKIVILCLQLRENSKLVYRCRENTKFVFTGVVKPVSSCSLVS